MPSTRARNKAEIGGYFDLELVANVRLACEALGVTVTDFATEAYRRGLDLDRRRSGPVRSRRSVQ
jgi:hypothetical protein